MQLPVASPWFARQQSDDIITQLWEPHVHPMLRCNIWHVRGRRRDLMIDTGLGIGSLRTATSDLIGHSLLAIATNFHCDHVGGLHEFDNRAIHRGDAKVVRTAEGIGGTLLISDLAPGTLAAVVAAGFVVDGEVLLTALPRADYDVAGFSVEPPAPTMVLDEGDVIDLGGRVFEVLHLPGHSPGTIGLWDVDSGVLFSGDAIHDGPLLDEIPGADADVYVETMELLYELPVEVVHAGHGPSFGRERLRELTRAYLDGLRPSLV